FRFSTIEEEIRLKQHVDTILSDAVALTLERKPRILPLREQENPPATYSFIARRDPLHKDMQDPDIQRFKRMREKRLGYAMRVGLDIGTNDTSFWPGVPTILTRPMGGSEHTASEWLDLQSLQGFAKDIVQFIQEKNQELVSSS